MLEVRLDPALKRHLANIAARTDDAPGELARRALLKYLEDLEDYATAVEAWRNRTHGEAKSSEEVLREFGVAE